MNSTDELKNCIREDLSDEITCKGFDVGYLQGSSVVHVRNKADILELCSLLQKPNSNVVLWCNGLRTNKHARSESEDESGNKSPNPRKRHKRNSATDDSRRNAEVQGYVDTLRTRHGSNYSPMQLRIWGEMIAGGLHTSQTDPPTTTMFSRAGSGMKVKKDTNSPVIKAVTDAASAITSAVMGKPRDVTSLTKSSNGSPAKLIENRSKLYKQLSDLKNLKDAGVLSDDEYYEEKEAIMDFLKQLNPKK